MAFYFFDSSALVKYYVSEIGSGWVEAVIDAQPPNHIALAQIAGVEVVAALAQRVRAGGGYRNASPRCRMHVVPPSGGRTRSSRHSA